MRLKKKIKDPEAAKLEAMKRADALTKKKLTHRYYARLNSPDSKDDLEENFEKVEGEGTDPLPKLLDLPQVCAGQCDYHQHARWFSGFKICPRRVRQPSALYECCPVP